MNKLYVLLNTFIFLITTSCVGTIDKAPSTTVTTPAKSEKLTFQGVDSCKAISHDKIEVLFEAAKIEFGTIKTEDLIYQVYLNGRFDQASASGRASELLLDDAGYYHLLVKNLAVESKYIIAVRVLDPLSGQTDANTITCSVETDEDKKPNFDGLKELVPYPGKAGATTALLKWNEALPSEYVFAGIPNINYTIKKYKIYKGTSADNLEFYRDIYTDANDYSGNSFPAEVVLNANNHPIGVSIPALTTGQKYYFKVNAVDQEERAEKNEIIRPIELSLQTEIIFAGVTKVETIQKDQGYNALSIEWAQGSGNFTKYRIFAISSSDVNFNSINSINAPNVLDYHIKDIDNPTITADTLLGLESNKTYRVFVVACYSEDLNNCDTTPAAQGGTVFKEGTTTPKLRAFGGVYSFTQPSGQAGLDSAKLLWNSPSNEGVCDEIVIKDMRSDVVVPLCSLAANATTDICIDDFPTNTDADLFNDSKDCTNSNGAIIKNLNLTISEENKIFPYCFQAYVVSNGREQIESTRVTKCGQLTFERPVFQGDFLTCEALSATEIKVSWTAPIGGLADNFVLFKKEGTKNDSVDGVLFSSEAQEHYTTSNDANIGESYPSYDDYAIPLTEFSKTFTASNGMLPNTKYHFLIKTVADVKGTLQYDANAVIKSCTTKDEQYEFQEMVYIGAFGPSLPGTKDTVTKESLVSLDGAAGEVSGITFSQGQPTDGEQGNVGIAFKNFKKSGGTSSFIPTQADDGYYLFYNENFDLSTTKSSLINFLDEDTPGWKLANAPSVDYPNGAPILPDGNKGFVEIIHKLGTPRGALNTIDTIHPISESDIPGVRERSKRGKLLTYAIKLKASGSFVAVNNDSAENMIFQVIVPPANMALLHPWIINKEHCTNLGLEYDKLKGYRCQTSGAGSVNEDENGSDVPYFEEKAFSLIDRANLGCRGNYGEAYSNLTDDPIKNHETQTNGTVYVGGFSAPVTDFKCAINIKGVSRDPGEEILPAATTGERTTYIAADAVSPTKIPALSYTNPNNEQVFYYSANHAGLSGDPTDLNTIFPADGNWHALWYEPDDIGIATIAYKRGEVLQGNPSFSSSDFNDAGPFPGYCSTSICYNNESSTYKAFTYMKASSGNKLYKIDSKIKNCGISIVSNSDPTWDVEEDNLSKANIDYVSDRPGTCSLNAKVLLVGTKNGGTHKGTSSYSFFPAGYTWINTDSTSTPGQGTTNNITTNIMTATELGNPIGIEIDRLIPGFEAEFKFGSWMKRDTAIFPAPLPTGGREYHDRAFSLNTGDEAYGIGESFAAGGDDRGIELPISNLYYLCQSQSIQLAIGSGSNDYSKHIRKRLISAKEANFSKDIYIENTIEVGTALNDQALCSTNGNGTYSCYPNPDLTGSLFTDFKTFYDGFISYPFTAYKSSDTILPDHHIFLDQDNNRINFTINDSNSDPKGVFGRYLGSSTTTPYSNIDWISPTKVAEKTRCAVQIELDYIGSGILKVDER